MRKIINSATTQYEPVLTEELVLDDRPISGSFNSITSDAVYKAISVDPGNVPPVESTDDGKVLTASYGAGGGSFEWADSPKELPESLGTAGQVLQVNAGATGVEWATPSGGGSTYTAGDGIAISAQDAISAKVGGGVTIGNASSTSTVTSTLSVVPYYSQGDYAYIVASLTRLTNDLVTALNNGPLTATTLIDFVKTNATPSSLAVDYYPIIALYSAEWGFSLNKYIVFGQTPVTNGDTMIATGTSIVYDVTDINTSLSNNLTWAEVEANPSAYVLFALPAYNDGTIHPASDYYVSSMVWPTSASVNTATASYQGTVTVPNSIILERPVPAYAAGDAGKVLSVNAGATGVEWATPSGGGGGAGALYVTYSRPANASEAVAMGATIKSALDANKAVFLKYNTSIIPLVDFSYEAIMPGFETVTMIFNGMGQNYSNSLTCYTWDVQVSMGSLVEDGIKTYTISTT